MGRPMASNLARKGFALVVHDVRREPVEALAKLGAASGNGAAGVTQASEIVVTMLPDSPDVEAAALAPGGILDNAKPGQLLMDMSTVDPLATDRIARQLASAIVQAELADSSTAVTRRLLTRLPDGSGFGPVSKLSCAIAGGPPSPAKPAMPLPTTVESIPSGEILRIRKLRWSRT